MGIAEFPSPQSCLMEVSETPRGWERNRERKRVGQLEGKTARERRRGRETKAVKK